MKLRPQIRLHSSVLKKITASIALSTVAMGCTNYNGSLQMEGGNRAFATKDNSSTIEWVDVIDNTVDGGHSYVDNNGNIITNPPAPNNSPENQQENQQENQSSSLPNPGEENSTELAENNTPMPPSPVEESESTNNNSNGDTGNPPLLPVEPTLPGQPEPTETQLAENSNGPSDPLLPSNPSSPSTPPSIPVPGTIESSESNESNGSQNNSENLASNTPPPSETENSLPGITPTQPPVVENNTGSSHNPPTPEVESPHSNTTDSCQAVATNQCGGPAQAGSCGDDGTDNTTDNQDANECLAFRGFNIMNGLASRVLPHLNPRGKNVWLTDQPITQPISGHGKLVVIYTGKEKRGSILKIDGWKGKIILCGFAVEQIRKTRGKVVLVNSEVKKLEYSLGRVVANFQSTINNQTKLLSYSLSGGLLKAGVFSFSASGVLQVGSAQDLSSEPVRVKVSALLARDEAIKEHQLTISDLLNQRAQLLKKNNAASIKAVASIDIQLGSLQAVLRDLLNLRIQLERTDNDHDCVTDTQKVVEIDVFKKLREKLLALHKKAKDCRSEVAKNVLSILGNGLNSVAQVVTSVSIQIKK